MKKLTVISMLVMALTLSGCEAVFGSPETPTPIATYTPAPTYTPLPTYTPFPSPTVPPEPSATLVPLESPTSSVFGVTPTSASGQTASLLNSSFVREGPGLFYKPITHVDAGETVLVLGRDHDGFWLKIRTSAGQEGWVRLTQFVQPVDVRQIAEITDIPTPSVTVTVKATSGATKPPTTPGTPGTPATSAPSTSGTTFNLTRGGGSVCSVISPWYVNPALPIKDLSKGALQWKAGDQSQVGNTVWMLDTSQVPSGITVNIQGNVFGNTCTSACNLLTFTLCASASSSVSPGKYDKPVVLQFAEYDVSMFNAASVSGIPTVFNVN